MFITRECDYAVRSIRALADYKKRTVKKICTAEHIPQQYAYKILKKLEKSKIVCSTRGTDGGYSLCKSLDDITLFDIVKAVDDQLFLNECLNGKFECPNNQDDCQCIVHGEFHRIQTVLEQELASKTISELFQSGQSE